MVSFDDAGPKRAKVKKAATDEEEEEEPEPEPVAPVEEAKPEGYLVSKLTFQLNDLMLERKFLFHFHSTVIQKKMFNSSVPLQTFKVPTK